MNVGELKQALEGMDESMPVKVVLWVPDNEEEISVGELDGEMLEVGDERAITVEYGNLVIKADVTLQEL
jgi:hypothetical protein